MPPSKISHTFSTIHLIINSQPKKPQTTTLEIRKKKRTLHVGNWIFSLEKTKLEPLNNGTFRLSGKGRELIGWGGDERLGDFWCQVNDLMNGETTTTDPKTPPRRRGVLGNDSSSGRKVRATYGKKRRRVRGVTVPVPTSWFDKDDDGDEDYNKTEEKDPVVTTDPITMIDDVVESQPTDDTTTTTTQRDDELSPPPYRSKRATSRPPSSKKRLRRAATPAVESDNDEQDPWSSSPPAPATETMQSSPIAPPSTETIRRRDVISDDSEPLSASPDIDVTPMTPTVATPTPAKTTTATGVPVTDEDEDNISSSSSSSISSPKTESQTRGVITSFFLPKSSKSDDIIDAEPIPEKKSRPSATVVAHRTPPRRSKTSKRPSSTADAVLNGCDSIDRGGSRRRPVVVGRKSVLEALVAEEEPVSPTVILSPAIDTPKRRVDEGRTGREVTTMSALEISRKRVGVVDKVVPKGIGIGHKSGLTNLGNTCYLNASIQLLFSHPSFLPTLPPSNPLTPPLLQSSHGNPTPLKHHLDATTTQFLGDQQRDAHEFLTEIIDSLESPLFDMSVRVDLICEECGYERGQEECFKHLSIDVKENVLGGWEGFFEEERREVRCEKCDKGKGAMRRMKVTKWPGLLLLHLKRFIVGEQEEGETGGGGGRSCVTKDVAAVSYPRLLQLDGGGGKGKEEEYEMRGVIHHWGNRAYCGHYTTDARVSRPNSEGGDEEEEGWYRFDDKVVTKVEEREVMKGTTTAYVFLYERRMSEGKD